MPKNRSKPKSVQPRAQSSQGHTGPSESPKWGEMAENGGENEVIGSRLSPDHPDSSSDPSGSPEWLEMTENAGENKISGLTLPAGGRSPLHRRRTIHRPSRPQLRGQRVYPSPLAGRRRFPRGIDQPPPGVRRTGPTRAPGAHAHRPLHPVLRRSDWRGRATSQGSSEARRRLRRVVRPQARSLSPN